MSQKNEQTQRFQRDLPASHETSVLVPTFPILPLIEHWPRFVSYLASSPLEAVTFLRPQALIE